MLNLYLYQKDGVLERTFSDTPGPGWNHHEFWFVSNRTLCREPSTGDF